MALTCSRESTLNSRTMTPPLDLTHVWLALVRVLGTKRVHLRAVVGEQLGCIGHGRLVGHLGFEELWQVEDDGDDEDGDDVLEQPAPASLGTVH